MSAAMLIHGLGWAILHSLWKDSLLGGATALALWRLRQSSAQVRYVVACLGLLLSLLVPVVDAWRGMAAYREAAQWLPLWQALQPAQQAGLAAILTPALPWLVGAWLIGVSLMLLRLTLGVIWVQRLAATGEAWLDERWLLTVKRLAARMDIAKPLAMRLHDTITSPMTAGWLRPLVLIPAALLVHLPAEQLEALLAHELAHIKRRDYLVNLLQSLVEALLFYHPVIWWLSRRIRAEREQVADDLAVQAIDDRRSLALALQALDQHQAAQLVQAANGGQLLDRIRHLVRPGRQTRGWRIALPLAGIVLASLAIHAMTNAPTHDHDAPKPAAQVEDTAAFASLAANLHASHALVVDDDTGRVLLQKDADAVTPIASISKLLTAMVVLDAQPDLQAPITIDRATVRMAKYSVLKLPAGTTLPRGEALKLALVPSDNRAAEALAQNYPGGLPAFMEAAKAKIAALGLAHTIIEEPTGLSANNQATAQDLATLARAASNYPDIARLTAIARDSTDIGGKTVSYHNANVLVGSPGWQVLVSKTGTTREAGKCLVMRVNKANRHLTVVLLNADDFAAREQDATEILQHFGSAADLH